MFQLKRPLIFSLTILAALLASTYCGRALMLDKEISRMPADKRPTPEQVAAAKAESKAWDDYQDQLMQRLEPQLQAWAKKGKPYIPRAIFPADLLSADVPAFPGAEGAGKFSFGGRGGQIFVVTNLTDSGPGSFREACEAAGPRTVVFNVAGIIRLHSPLHVIAPYLTIAGQSAPGDGVCVAGYSTLIDTHDVVIRYMRFRRGATNLFDRDDCLGGQPIGNVIVDHCSCSWGLDENLSMYRHVYRPKDSKEFLKYPTLNITIQWCISSEALNTYDHAFGGTWGGCNTSFHHNLFACDTGRNPSIGMSYDFNFVDNTIFNWRHRTLDGGDRGSSVNCINNYYQSGPVTPETAVRHRIGMPQSSTLKPDLTVRFGKWYVAGNFMAGDAEVTADNWKGVQFKSSGTEEEPSLTGMSETDRLISRVRETSPFPMPPITVQPAQEAHDAVLANAGAMLPVRDSVDVRAIHQVQTGTVEYTAGKGIITDISQVGGYPNYQGQPAADVGADGIPLWWKVKYGLDTNDTALAAKDLTGDGYTVIEKYLDGLDPKQKIDWSNAKNNANTLTLASLRAAQ